MPALATQRYRFSLAFRYAFRPIWNFLTDDIVVLGTWQEQINE